MMKSKEVAIESAVTGENKQQTYPVRVDEVYTNVAMLNATPYEFEITLGLGSSNYEGVRPVVNVRMSPQFAKEFSQLLQDNVKQFEDKFGEIKLYKPDAK